MDTQKCDTFFSIVFSKGGLCFSLAVLLLILLYTKKVEGFDEREKNKKEFTLVVGKNIYDDFYSKIYDSLVMDQAKNDFEIMNVINITKPTANSVFLDIGSGTGHHVGQLRDSKYDAVGIDISPSMNAIASKNYPESTFKTGDCLDTMMFASGSFSHILCLYFTIYYIKDKKLFFGNCNHWLSPDGFLILHLVDREKFDPIIPAGNPFKIVSPQKYADERITKTNVNFNGFDYKAFFDFKNDNVSLFKETFVPKKNGKTRQNEHVFYMETHLEILTIAKSCGFKLIKKIDMVDCGYDNQFLCILQKI